MTSGINAGTPPTPATSAFPALGVAVSKAIERANWAYAKFEIEALQAALAPTPKPESGTTITIDAAYFGEAYALDILCTSAAAIIVTLAADVPQGRSAHVIRMGAGNVTLQAGAGATLRKTTMVQPTTAEQYDARFVKVISNTGGSAAEWHMS